MLSAEKSKPKEQFDHHRTLFFLWIACTIAIIAPVWTQRLLPMLDSPSHLALVNGWHHYDDPAWRISEFYTVRVRPVPYILFYGAIHLLMYVFSIETANKLFLTGYLIIFPLSVLSLTRTLKRSAWQALPAFVLAFSPAWIYGFSSYMAGTAMFNFSLAALLRLLDVPTKRDRWLLLLFSLLMYFSHVMPWFVFGVIVIVLLAPLWREPRRMLAPVLSLLPSLLLAIVALIEDAAEKTYMRAEGFAATWRDVPTSIIEFPRRVMELFPGSLDMVALALIGVPALIVWWLRPKDDADEVQRRTLLRRMLWTMAFLYVALPYEITKPMSWWYVAPRLPALMLPIVFMLPSALDVRRLRWLMAPTLVAVLILSVKLVTLYRGFSARHSAFMSLIDRIPTGAPTLVLVNGMWSTARAEENSGDPSTSGPVHWHFSSWPMALRGGIAPYVFDQGIPLRFSRRLNAPLWNMADAFELRQAPAFEYYIFRHAAPVMFREPSIEIVEQIGDWTLFRRIHQMSEEP